MICPNCGYSGLETYVLTVLPPIYCERCRRCGYSKKGDKIEDPGEKMEEEE
jgi:predicted Zn-ribbon and HTH transcriptional regulator